MTRELIRTSDRDLARARTLARDLDLALDSDLRIASKFTHELIVALVRVGALQGGRALDDALGRARELERLVADVNSLRSRPPSCVFRCGWQRGSRARLLPGAERARYREEFGSELTEIALAGGGRREQLAYAIRTLLRARPGSSRRAPDPAPTRRRPVTGTVKAMGRYAAKVAAGVIPAAAVARLGMPAIGALALLAVLILAFACWVIGNQDRTDPGQPDPPSARHPSPPTSACGPAGQDGPAEVDAEAGHRPRKAEGLGRVLP